MKIPKKNLVGRAVRRSSSKRMTRLDVAIADILRWALETMGAQASPSKIRINAILTCRLAAFWGTCRVGDITMATVEDYRRSRLNSGSRPRQLSRARIEAELQYLYLQIKRFCREHDLGRTGDVSGAAEPRHLGRRDINRLLQVAHARIRSSRSGLKPNADLARVLTITLQTGMRLDEVLRMRRRDED